MMLPSEEEYLVQLATRVPKHLHQQLKLYCVQHDESVMGFITAALEERLKRVKAKAAPRKA